MIASGNGRRRASVLTAIGGLLVAATALAQDASSSGVPVTELLSFVYSGRNAIVFALLNALALGAMRVEMISQRFAFSAVAVVGSILGALSGLIEAQAVAGVNTLILSNAVIVGLIAGAGSSTIIGWSIGTVLARVGLPPSDAKQKAEAIRDPMNPAQPPPAS